MATHNNGFLLTQEIWAHFTNYLYVLWKHLGLPPPTPVQLEAAEWLQHGPNKSLLLAFRGMAKSWIAGAKVTYDLGLNPEYHKYMIISAGEDKALEQSLFIRRIIETFPLLSHLRPKPGSSLRWSGDAFDVEGSNIAQAPSVRTKGITGQLTGGRPTDILFDDIECPKNSATVEMRAKLLKATEEFEALLVPGGSAKGLGTPQTEETVYRVLETERSYQVLYVPVVTPSEREAEIVYSGHLAAEVKKLMAAGAPVGTPVDPLRFGTEVVATKAAGMTTAGFKLHFMLDTTLSDADRYPLKISDLIITNVDSTIAPLDIVWASGKDQTIQDIPMLGFRGDKYHRPMHITESAWKPYQQKLMTIDPAGRGKDEVGWGVGGELGGRVFVIDYGGNHGGYDADNLRFLCDKAIDSSVSAIVLEDNFGDGMFGSLLQPVLALRCVERGYTKKIGIIQFKSTGKGGHKWKRIIDTLEPLMKAHRLIIDVEAIRRDVQRTVLSANRTDGSEGSKEATSRWFSMLMQMSRITNNTNAIPHDDQLEAIQMLCEFLKDSLAKDTSKNVQKHQQQQFKEQMEQWQRGTLGYWNKRKELEHRKTSSEGRGALATVRRCGR